MRKNVYFGITLILVLALIATLPFAFDNSFLAVQNNLVIYLFAKILCGMIYVGTAIYVFVMPTANTITASTLGISLGLQIVPLILRFILPLSAGFVWSVVILIVAILIFVAFLGLSLTSNTKILDAEKKSEGSTIAVKDEHDLVDENNKFKGRKEKDE